MSEYRFAVALHVEYADLQTLMPVREGPKVGTPRPGTEVSRALWARNPKRVRKESERVSLEGGKWGGKKYRRTPKTEGD